MDLDALALMTRVNFDAAVRASYVFARHLKRQGQGAIGDVAHDRLLETGETGAVALPALLTLPAFGSWEVGSATATGWARSDCFRSQDLNTLELKVGEVRTAEGLYHLPAGRHRAVFTLRPKRPAPLFRDDAPAVARRALARTQWTALTFRTDTATLSNNGASMHYSKLQSRFELIKPETCLNFNLCQEIIAMLEEKGFEIRFVLQRELTKQEASNLYYKHEAKDYFNRLVAYNTTGESLVMLLSHKSEDPISALRAIVGAKEPDKAKLADQIGRAHV